MSLHRRPERPDLPPPPDDLIANTHWCRWWWVGVGASLAVYPDGAGVLTWSIGGEMSPWCRRAHAIVDAHTVAAIEREFHDRGRQPPGVGGR
jgi:hypothetical protein